MGDFDAGMAFARPGLRPERAGFGPLMSDKARHFVMLDDPEGFFEATDGFLAGGKPAAPTK